VKNAASSKSSKTDGRTLLVNTRSLRVASDNAPAGTDADDSWKSDNDRAVVATGFAVVADYTDKLPANDFFTPGRLFAVRVKHSNFPGELCYFLLPSALLACFRTILYCSE